MARSHYPCWSGIRPVAQRDPASVFPARVHALRGSRKFEQATHCGSVMFVSQNTAGLEKSDLQLWLVARSTLYAFQAKTAANVFAHEAIEAFYQDANITETFHSLLNRKWDQ